MVVVVLSTLVTSIAYTIGYFEKIATTYAWLKQVASTKWKELDKYILYLQVVKEVTEPYGTSNCSETAITGALQLLDGELTESWSKVDEWMRTRRVYKQLMADDFIKEMKSSRTTIDQNLQLFSTAVQTWEKKEATRATLHTNPTLRPVLFKRVNVNGKVILVPLYTRPPNPDHAKNVGTVLFIVFLVLAVITKWNQNQNQRWKQNGAAMLNRF